MSKRHFWKKSRLFSWVYGHEFLNFFFRELSKRHSWKINPDLKSCPDFFSRNDAYSFLKNPFFQKLIEIIEMLRNGYFFQKCSRNAP